MFTRSSLMALASVRACWEVAALDQFYRVFGTLEAPKSIDELEASLVGGDEVFLVSLLPPLLSLSADTDAGTCWEAVAAVLLGDEAIGFASDPPPTSFAALSASDRGRLLYTLADASLSTLSRGPDLDQATSRGEMLGADGKGATYWCLGDRRIYREGLASLGKGKKKRSREEALLSRPWETVATCAAQWRELAATLKTKGAEGSLRITIEQRVDAVEAEEARATNEAKRQAIFEGQRRTSTRMEAKEGEELSKALALAERQERLRLVDLVKSSLRQMSAELLDGGKEEGADELDEAHEALVCAPP